MSELYQSLSHSKRDCQYPVVLVPKRRRKLIFGRHAGNRVRFPRAGPAKGMPDYRRTSDARPCAYVYRNSPQTPRGIGDRVPQGEECDRHRSPESVFEKLTGDSVMQNQ